LYAFFKYLSTYSDSELTVYENFSTVSTPNSSWPNFTFNLKLNPSAVTTQLIKIQAAIDNNQTPNYIIVDDAQLDRYEEELTKLNFVPLAEWSCLKFNNKKVVLDPPLTDFTIKKVNTEEELNKWIGIASSGFGKLDFSLFEKCYKNKEVVFFSGYLQSNIIATAMLFFDNEKAGIYHVVTLPEHQKKGYGSHIFKHCQQEALAYGSKQIIAQSTSEGLNAWENTGMKEFGKFYLFCWNKPKE
jgi:GNAT superfamily N-acetyltransferase